MATLQNIRNRAGILVAVVIGLALVAFILGDALQQGNTIFQKSQNKIAEINGESLQYIDFQKKVEEFGEIYKMNSGQSQIDENTWVQVREQVWQNYLRDVLMGEVYEDLGIAVSGDELFDLVQGNNLHPIIRQLFANPNTGQVNRAAIVSFLKNLETNVSPEQRSYWYYLEKQISDDRVLTKYNNLVKQGLYVTTEEAQKSLDNHSHQVNFDYIALSYNSISDSALAITEKDLKNYYNEHIEEYKQEKTRQIEYIVFPINPSEQDNLHAKEWIEDIQNDFASTEENAQFTNSNSDEGYVDVWAKQSDLSTEVGNWVYEKGAKVNDVFGPYFENEAYKLAKVNAIEMLPDSVEARHILLPFTNQTELIAKQALADSLKSLIENGSDFATLAQEYSTDKGSAINGGDLGWFSRGQMVKPFEDAAFGNAPREVSIAVSQFGVHVIQTTKRSALSQQVKIAYMVRKVNASDVTYQRIYADASKFASENRTLKKFDEAVVAQNLNKRVATVHEQDQNIVGLTNARQLVRAAFDTEVGDIIHDFRESSIFELGDNFVIATLMGATDEGYAPLENVKSRVELAVAKQKKAEKLVAKINAALNSSQDFSVVANELGAEIKTASNINFNSFSIAEAGVEPALIGTVSTMEAGQVSKPVSGNNAVYLAKVTSVAENPASNLAQEKLSLTQGLAYRVGFQAYEAVKNNAEILDRRSKFY